MSPDLEDAIAEDIAERAFQRRKQSERRLDLLEGTNYADAPDDEDETC